MKVEKELLQTKISLLPKKPGVYQFFNNNNKIIYVGKAKNLKSRVNSYFRKDKTIGGKTALLVKKITHLEYIVVESEIDALLLENSLIKQYQPKYNIQLKDDKTYPWLCIKKEPFPRIFPTRNKINDGSDYLGPYASVKVMNTLLDLLKQLYPIRTCNFHLSKSNIEKKKFKICLEYHIGNCLGPCEGKHSENDYNDLIKEAKWILKGNTNLVLNKLKEQIAIFSKNYQFEEAQIIKNKLDLLEKYQAKSTIVNPNIHNVDVISIVSELKTAYVNYLKIMNGCIVQSYNIELTKHLNETNEELIQFALIALREKFGSDAKEVLVSEDISLSIKYLTTIFPKIGEKRKLVELSLKNADYFRRDKIKQQNLIDPEKSFNRILNQLKTDLNLSFLPVHIECFDNSNIQGTNPASACVVFKNAKPSKKDYRHYNINTVQGPNDFASMEEVVYRRYKRLLDEGSSLPQLIIIDGGKGQLSSALKSIKQLNLTNSVTIIGIAKKLEEIFFPNDSNPIFIDKRSESLKLIQHLRNEAHRFSLAHHRNRRKNHMLQNELEQIPGVGQKSAEKLYSQYKTIKTIQNLTLEELEKTVNKSIAKNIITYFRFKGQQN